MPPQAMLEAMRLYVTDGATYEVRHPDLVWIAPGYLVIGVPPAIPQPATIERHVIVDLLHVTRLEPIAAASQGNGH